MITDFHTHVLPGVDDGSASVEESLALLQMEAEQGIGQVVATPHFYANHDTPERFLQRRERAEATLREALTGKPDMPELFMGAEVYFFPGMSDSDALNELTIHKKRYILLEMPFTEWTNQVYREIEAIHRKQGLIPVIAHVDRYIAPMRTFGIPERLSDLPVLVQANASFFLKMSTRGMAMRMLSRGQIHLLGSDCHNLTTRKPNLGEALRRIESRLGREAVDRIRGCEREVLCI